MCVDLNKKILGTFEKIYEFGGITLEKYKELLEESSENIDVTPYFSKLYNNKKIDKKELVSSLGVIKNNLEKRLNNFKPLKTA
ncbi:hypothetical protein COU58_01225 [Candidatus Pacearchaeota archaeon CG10_big_fil_rev_8_21_14_0_10_32_42]|nr:MAG: hypothetical protein COU58_01225 [Candidatus Pacearchaeota archaeon CG10_big_fil_rev_8_21_14_0_10_32_42]